ncbi:MAG: carboxymuconolactone decarboxylase family protein [Alphaproteobacteria bacterium]|nr:carboxymuconolactone decarboxylase family protein [Alphaproteobacteria bacterium]
MARVRDIGPGELPDDAAAIYRRYVHEYGPFANQVATLAHVPAAVRHLPAMLMELRAAATLPRRYLELAIVAVSKRNACHYCVGHHVPMLAVEGVPADAVAQIPDRVDHTALTDIDRLVIAYSVAVNDDPHRIRDSMHAELRRHFSEAQIVELTLRIALTGFFNKFSEALGIEEEPSGNAAAQ